MQVLDPNNIKIYNLSSGRSIPDWLSDRKKRLLLKKHADLRRRVELIQDFEMPILSTSIRLSPDEHYIIATGIYKPRVRCYDVDNLAMKFERCFDSEVVTFEILSEDYSKMVFLQCDRYIEFHSAEGRYYRLRIPKFGHDMKYHPHYCDLFLVGTSSDIYRLNLEKGQYQTSFVSSQTSEMNKVAINMVHGLVLTGSKEGKVEAWDPRSGSCISNLDCALACLLDKGSSEEVPAVTALNFNGNLTCGVGMSTGQVLLYDIRTNKPFRIKDHMNELPIKDVEFLGDYVLSMDPSIVKIWNKEEGNLFTSIDAGNMTRFNNLCVVPNSGMMFIANENMRILTYYIPSLGSAPKWCGFLDALTEELEESNTETVYDDYKFVTEKQLEELGLSHLIGSDLLRAYMHGYFMDVRLYRKAVSVSEPFEFEKYRSKKIKEKLDEEKPNRVQIHKSLPPVNKPLAMKLLEEKNKNYKRSKEAASILNDERFKPLFENPDFEVDPQSEEYRLLTPVLKRRSEKIEKEEFQSFVEEDESNKESSDDFEDNEDESNVQEHELPVPIKKKIKSSRKKRTDSYYTSTDNKQTKVYQLTSGQNLTQINAEEEKMLFGDRLKNSVEEAVEVLPFGNRSYSFVSSEGKGDNKRKRDLEKHQKERKKLIRPAPYKKLRVR